MQAREVSLKLADVSLPGDLVVPDDALGLVIFVHGSGSSRLSSRNRFVAQTLQRRGFATLLFDLLTEREDRDHRNRFDIERLTERLLAVTRWCEDARALAALPFAYFGASTGAAAALKAAAVPGAEVRAVISRGGRPDLAMPELHRVRAPTLLIVGSLDTEVIELNRRAKWELAAPNALSIVRGATHLFEDRKASCRERV